MPARTFRRAGDVIGDGFDDLIVGAPGNRYYGGFSGRAYVVFGTASGFGTLDAAGRAVHRPGQSHGRAGLRHPGRGRLVTAPAVSVSSAGDVNGDGFDDLIVGAPGGDDGGSLCRRSLCGVRHGLRLRHRWSAGRAGHRSGAPCPRRRASSSRAMRMDDYAGRSVSSAGDVNGDGFDDLIVGAPLWRRRLCRRGLCDVRHRRRLRHAR